MMVFKALTGCALGEYIYVADILHSYIQLLPTRTLLSNASNLLVTWLVGSDSHTWRQQHDTSSMEQPTAKIDTPHLHVR